tara:strand:+ start:219 stop:602 length:384 start_codon:yes stop_codon:yes gene_type:complete
MAEAARRRVVRQGWLFLQHALDGSARQRFPAACPDINGRETTSHAQAAGVLGKAIPRRKQGNLNDATLNSAVCTPALDGIVSQSGNGQLLLYNGRGKVLGERAASLAVATPEADLPMAHALWLALHA